MRYIRRYIRIWLAMVCGVTLPVAAADNLLYENSFENAQIGSVPEDFLVLEGDFSVKAADGNQVLELPGAPLETFGVLFGPAESADVAVSARIYGTAKGRRYPTFGVGVGGVGGYRLQVSPGKRALELFRGEAVKASVPHEWAAGAWTHFWLQVRKVKDGQWKVQGKVWKQGDAQPKDWVIAFEDREQPVSGRASVWGSPFSGTPIRFDDLVVSRISTAP